MEEREHTMSEQSQTATAAQATTTSAYPHPEVVGRRWGDPISEERQAELKALSVRQREWAGKPVAERGDSAFKGVALTGADIYWLAERARDADGWVRTLNLEGAILFPETHLEGAVLLAAHLERTIFIGVHLEGASLGDAHLEGAVLGAAHLERTFLFEAHLEGAILREARLEGADLRRSHLEGADLRRSHLEGADLAEAYLGGANFSEAWFDSKTVLSNATLNTKTRLGDIQWSGVGAVNLTQINWDQVPRLGDEQDVGPRSDASKHEAVVRAYRQVAAQLRAQGMNEVADRFLYRAQVRQRGVLLRRFRIPQYLGSWFLDLISGYGYKPVRSLITYVLVILAFALAYLTLGGTNGQALSWNEAIVISMTAFHGRGFFSSVFQPGDIQAAVAAAEAFIGLLIEIVFIATFTQRFFAR
jgi:uncharacterized protein YjbI with pentapeptide repeats